MKRVRLLLTLVLAVVVGSLVWQVARRWRAEYVADPISSEEWAGTPETLWIEEGIDRVRHPRMEPRADAPEPGPGILFSDTADGPLFALRLRRIHLAGPEHFVGYAATDRVIEYGKAKWRELRKLDRTTSAERIGKLLRREE